MVLKLIRSISYWLKLGGVRPVAVDRWPLFRGIGLTVYLNERRSDPRIFNFHLRFQTISKIHYHILQDLICQFKITFLLFIGSPSPNETLVPVKENVEESSKTENQPDYNSKAEIEKLQTQFADLQKSVLKLQTLHLGKISYYYDDCFINN